MKNISILGSTGSIGKQTLDVLRNLNDFKVVGLACDSNIDLFEKQIREFKPKIATVFNKDKAKILKERVKDIDIKISAGMDGLIEVAAHRDNNLCVISISGSIGILPTLEAIKNRINIALATKEILVSAGELITFKCKEYNVKIIPIDSEHSAIMQCLDGHNKPKQIILTASGGPFRGMNKSELQNVMVEEALKHPTWEMGRKITIDSATLMNKGLEVIEARWLFNMDSKKINVVIHPQSIVHSMVEYEDGSVIAQLGASDMRIPIQYALAYPNKVENDFEKLDLVGKMLAFEEADHETFKSIKLAYHALEACGTMPAVLNASNEVAVDLFLNRKIKFLDIQDIVEQCMNNHENIKNPTLNDILNSEKWAREVVHNLIK